MDSGNESDHNLIFTDMLEDLTGEKRVIKHVIVLSEDNWNGKELQKLRET